MGEISYQLQRTNGPELRFSIDLNRIIDPVQQAAEHHPGWCRLEHERCPNCPLDAEAWHYCPVAIEVESIARHFADTASIERTDVWVHAPERSYFKNCDMQTAIRSLFGLIMATSACPVLAQLRCLADSHLPFATLEESVQRLVGFYLTNQYIHSHDRDVEPDWELTGIQALFRELRVVNTHLMKRVKAGSREDANINAIQTFISIAFVVDTGVDDVVARIIPLLRPAQ